MSKRPVAVLAALAIAACAEPTTTGGVAEEQSPAPFAVGEAEPIPGQYIVVLRDATADVPRVSDVLLGRAGGRKLHTYTRALKGFSARLDAAALAQIQADPNVAYVEQDQRVRLTATQTGATWGLDRTDQRALPLSGSYSYTNTGSGVNAYIIDTGIRFTHAEFGSRAVSGFDAVDGGPADDCHGHGTHVAGTVGGSTYGIAKDVTLWAVRVLDCGGSGSNSGVIAGVDWVTNNHASHPGPSVANMSLGGGASTALDNAVRNSIASGVTYAIAAGNGNWIGIHQDACKYSPARVAEAITIGATDKNDKKASWSNYGNCVDFFGPGVSITSAWYTSNTATNTISGTSMATPHVAGVAALYLQSNPNATPQTVRDALYDNTTKGVVTSSRTTNNHLLFSNY